MLFNCVGLSVHKDLAVETPIYRMIPAERLLQFLQTKDMYFHQITAWEDPWEICSRFMTSEKPNLTIEGSRHMAASCYGTCWTKEVDSDAFWRIYSPDKNSVCIKTTVNKLFESIDFCTVISSTVIAGFMGPIRYVDFSTKDGWSVFDDEQSKYYPSYMVPAFIKRKAFEHEHEVRFLMMNVDHIAILNTIKKTSNGKGIYIPFKDTSFIEEIILDPRSDDERIQIYQNLLAPYGIAVSKSHLYDTPTKLSPLKKLNISNDPDPIGTHQVWLGNNFKTIEKNKLEVS